MRTTAACGGMYGRQKQQAATVRSGSRQEAPRRLVRRLVCQQLARQRRHDGTVMAQPLSSGRVAFWSFLLVSVSRLQILQPCQAAGHTQRRQVVERISKVASMFDVMQKLQGVRQAELTETKCGMWIGLGAPASRGCSALRAIFSAVVCTLPDVRVCARCSSSTMATRSEKLAPMRADRSPANTRSACARADLSQRLHCILDRMPMVAM